MANIIKVRCTGPEKHVNAIDLDEALRPTVVLRDMPSDADRRIPERLVRQCEFCSHDVILTREMIQENL
jgi:hypothetical protein